MICGINLLLEKLMEEVKPVGLTLVAGPEKSGKTDLLVEMAKYVAKEEKQKVLFFSLEHEKEELINKYIGSDVPFDIDDTPGISMSEVENKCRTYTQNHGLKMVFIDYFLLMEPAVKRCSRVEEIETNIKDLKTLAKDLNIAITVIAPLMHYGVCRKPVVSDFREYGFPIENMVDSIFFIWRENWTYEITVWSPEVAAKEAVAYRFKDEWGEVLELDRRMEERKRAPLFAEWEKETKNIMSNLELSLEFEKYERELQIALDKAILLAAKYHSGQRDKQGESYILHPLRVMLHTTDSLSRMTAVLHDILEDTECTEDILREEGIPESVIENLQCLTRCKDEDYFAYINRVNQDYFCKCIKQKDIEDNLREGCPESLEKRYRRALEILKERGPYYFHKGIKGNIDLAYSAPKEDGNVYVYCEQPDETYFFKTAMIRKNDLEIIGHYGFSQEELQEIVDEI